MRNKMIMNNKLSYIYLAVQDHNPQYQMDDFRQLDNCKITNKLTKIKVSPSHKISFYHSQKQNIVKFKKLF